MDLTVEQFIEAVTASPPDNSSGGHDQRRQPRSIIRAKVAIVPLSQTSHPSPRTVQVRDVSRSGIGFLLEQKMSLDEQFALVLPQTGDTPAVILCAVAFWQPLARDLFAVGARFSRILRDASALPLPIELNNPVSSAAAEGKHPHRMAG